MHAPANPTSRRIAQLLRLACSSEHPGEAAAAIQALNRTLAAAGLDFHELARVAETGLQLPVPTEQPKPEFRPRPRPPTTTYKPRRPGGRPLAMDECLICDQPNGTFRPCGCGGILFTVMPGVGPHCAQLICDACDRGGRWLSHAHFGATSS
jgi:hypothetical protein